MHLKYLKLHMFKEKQEEKLQDYNITDSGFDILYVTNQLEHYILFWICIL